MAKQTAEKNGQDKGGGMINITAPNLQELEFLIEGTAPYVQHAFGAKALEIMKKTQEEGQKAKSKKKREPKDFVALFKEAQHKTASGKNGIPAAAFRAACISACRVAGVVMTKAKLSVFAEADDYDVNDGQPLVLFTKGEPEHVEHFVRLETGVADIRARPMWAPGWQAKVRIKYDADQFDASSVTNLLMRAGMQVGIGEGRADSRKSAGMGWGFFRVHMDKIRRLQ